MTFLSNLFLVQDHRAHHLTENPVNDFGFLQAFLQFEVHESVVRLMDDGLLFLNLKEHESRNFNYFNNFLKWQKQNMNQLFLRVKNSRSL